MRETRGHIKATEGSGAFGTPRIPARSITWSMTAKAKPHKPSEFESVLLAIAGHDLRQPLQVLQNAREFLGRGVRTRSELRLLRLVQSAIDRLRDQLDELVAAHRFRGGAKGMKLTSVLVGPLLQQATYENEFAALMKGVSVRTVPTGATIESDALLLGTVLRNWSTTPSNTQSPVAAFSPVAGTPTRASALTCMTLESVLPGTRCLECSRPSPVLILRDAMVWALASSSCARRSEFSDIASTSLPLPVAGPAFPFSRARPSESEKPSSRSKDRKIASEIILPVPLTPAVKVSQANRLTANRARWRLENFTNRPDQ
jgi:hypothetical protein